MNDPVVVPREALEFWERMLADGRTKTDSGLDVTVLEMIDVNQAIAREMREHLAAAPTPAPAEGDALTWREEIAKHDAQPEGLGELPELPAGESHELGELTPERIEFIAGAIEAAWPKKWEVRSQRCRLAAAALRALALRRPVVVDADAVKRRLVAPIADDGAWPPNYARGFNDALRLVYEELPAALAEALGVRNG